MVTKWEKKGEYCRTKWLEEEKSGIKCPLQVNKVNCNNICELCVSDNIEKLYFTIFHCFTNIMLRDANMFCMTFLYWIGGKEHHSLIIYTHRDVS